MDIANVRNKFHSRNHVIVPIECGMWGKNLVSLFATIARTEITNVTNDGKHRKKDEAVEGEISGEITQDDVEIHDEK